MDHYIPWFARMQLFLPQDRTFCNGPVTLGHESDLMSGVSGDGKSFSLLRDFRLNGLRSAKVEATCTLKERASRLSEGWSTCQRNDRRR